MSIEQIAAEALNLPAKERALLAESLWESLVDPALVETQSEEAEIKLALERDAEIESGKVKPVQHSELFARLRQ
jgi:putative addiction module component (TIGR02574 family)